MGIGKKDLSRHILPFPYVRAPLDSVLCLFQALDVLPPGAAASSSSLDLLPSDAEILLPPPAECLYTLPRPRPQPNSNGSKAGRKAGGGGKGQTESVV